MGGSLNPQTADPEFANSPRHEFNFWFDPEAAHIALRAPWPRIDLTDVDISIKTQFTQAMLAEIATASQPGARYLARNTHEFYYLWDELAALVWLDPAIITHEDQLFLDVDCTRGPTYGDTLTWTATNKPARDDLRLVPRPARPRPSPLQQALHHPDAGRPAGRAVTGRTTRTAGYPRTSQPFS